MNKLIISILIFFIFSLNLVNAQYWFQSGAIATSKASFNNGASVSIKTVYNQTPGIGSFGFWVGETLSNGAFLQIGYEVPNETALFETNCTESGCDGNVKLTAGHPAWFWEYFPAGNSGGSFLGDIGGDNSAGANGTFNTYSFESFGNTWNFYFNGKKVGSANLGTSNSGQYSPVAFGEDAQAINNSSVMHIVQFKNFSFYNNGLLERIPQAYTYVGYGKTSETLLSNPFGVKELNNMVNYFEVGSGIPISNNTQLWKLGYFNNIISEYGGISSNYEYSAYSKVRISSPEYVYLNSTERAVFNGWKGYGNGAYSGNSNNATVYMEGNITEYAQWKIQYYFNVSSNYGSTKGSGWYDNGTIANFSINKSIIYINNQKREVFESWSNGIKNLYSKILMNSPKSVTAYFKTQYNVNLTTSYGGAEGGGWYDNGSTANISLLNPVITLTNNSRMVFLSWGKKYNQSNFSVTVNNSLSLNAIYTKQYLLSIESENAYGDNISVDYYVTSIGRTSSPVFVDNATTFEINSAYYKNVSLGIKETLFINKPMAVKIKLPVSNVTITTLDYFNIPVNASLDITFKNGTSIKTESGGNGTITFKNVPFGYIVGYAEYDGLVQNILNGKILYFISVINEIAILAAIAAAVGSIILLKRNARH